MLVATLYLVSPFVLADSAIDPHAHHHQLLIDATHATRSTVNYVVPPLPMVRQDGKLVTLSNEMNDGRPVVLSFIYTTCKSICPIVSQTFSDLQDQMGVDRDRLHLISISIDPEQDTPTHLQDYAKKFKAGPQWQFYTGTLAASIAAQRAFDVYRGDKMNHDPVTLFRPALGKPWVRINGFATANELLQLYQESLASQ